MKKVIWTDEMIAKAAKKYKTRNAFKKDNCWAYRTAHQRGILDTVCGHMATQRTHWTDEMIAKAAKKFTTHRAFQQGNNKAYAVAQNRGILNDVCRHMKVQYIYWTAEMIANEAKKFNTRDEFKKAAPVAYNTACKRGIMNEVASHMKPASIGAERWIYSYTFTVDGETKTYIGISNDLQKRHQQHINGHALFNTIRKPLKKTELYVLLHTVDYEYVISDASFSENDASIEEGKWLDHYKAAGHIILNLTAPCGLGAAEKWNYDMIEDIAKQYNSRKAFEMGNNTAYALARKRKMLDVICQHMETRFITWTYNMIANEANKFNTRSAFQQGNNKAYAVAQRRGILDDVCSHMIASTYVKWTVASLTEVAKKYDTRSAFARGNNSAYNAARRHGVLDDISTHMIQARK